VARRISPHLHLTQTESCTPGRKPYLSAGSTPLPTTKRMQRQTQNQSTSTSTTAVVSSTRAMHQSPPHDTPIIAPPERLAHPPRRRRSRWIGGTGVLLNVLLWMFFLAKQSLDERWWGALFIGSVLSLVAGLTATWRGSRWWLLCVAASVLLVVGLLGALT
jgi:hypothetical protein